MITEKKLDLKCKAFEEEYQKDLERIQQEDSIRINHFTYMESKLVKWNNELKSDMKDVKSDPYFSIIISFYSKLRLNIINKLGSQNLSFVIWKFEQDWQSNFYLQSNAQKHKGYFLRFWGWLSDYGTNWTKLLWRSFSITTIMAFLLVLIQLFCGVSFSDIYLTETIYTAFSAFIGSGQIVIPKDLLMIPDIAYRIVLMAGSILGYITLACIISIISIKFFFGGR